MARQQVGDDGIFSSGVNHRGRSQRSRYIRLCGNVPRTGKTAVLALTLVGEIEKGGILLDWPSERAAELIIVKWILRHSLAVKEITRVERIVAEEFETATMQAVRSGFGHDIHDRTRIPAEFRIRARNHRDLRQGVERQQRR